MTQQLPLLLKQLGQVLDIQDLTATDGYCCLFFDDIVINMEERDNALFLYTHLGPIPSNDRKALYAKLLEANALFKATQGATLGIDEASNMILLSHQTPISNLDYPAFEKTVENFINVAEAWIERIKDHGVRADATQPVTDAMLRV
ncbi:MAG: type III secretion system chaperone [Desulfobacterales bacterium]|nr:type III secretion system chaperone [Desulfobacterales bacterium]